MAVHKYLLKTFYYRINKKKYKLQIWQYNMQHTNIILMKIVILFEKNREKEMLLKSLAYITATVKVALTSGPINIFCRYK